MILDIMELIVPSSVALQQRAVEKELVILMVTVCVTLDLLKLLVINVLLITMATLLVRPVPGLQHAIIVVHVLQLEHAIVMQDLLDPIVKVVFQITLELPVQSFVKLLQPAMEKALATVTETVFVTLDILEQLATNAQPTTLTILIVSILVD